jgi:hypothetical protein
MNRKLVQRLIWTLVGIVFSAAVAQAQYRTSIQGVVTDPTGAVVPGATLTLTNPATGEKQIRTSNDSGVFNFNALPAAPFRLEAEKQGFQKQVIDNLQLIPEQANAVNVQLLVGTASQTVTVDASATPLLQTESASVNGVISDNQIQHMPSFGRDVMQLIQLTPGVFGDGAQGAGGNGESLPGMQGPGATGGNTGIFATENGAAALANGQQYQNNSVTIDGISTTSAVWGGTTVITPSEDSIDNVKVLSNGYDAEFGRFSGAQIQITSKSGTNQFHGSGFFIMHRPNFNAFQPFAGEGIAVERDPYFFDQFGAGLGGPIIKNKLFFYFNWETVRSPSSVPTPSTAWYDTPAFDALGPAGSISSTYLTFPGSSVISSGTNNVTCQDAGLVQGVNCNAVAGGLNIGTPLTAPLGSQDLGWTNATTNPGTGGNGSGGPENLGTIADIASYNTLETSNVTDNQYNGRLDWDVTSKDRVGFAIYWVPSSTNDLNGPAREYNLFHHHQINNAFSPVWNHTFSPTFLNEARVNAAGWRYNEISSNPQEPVGLPADNIDTIGNITIENFGPSIGAIYDQWTYSFKDVATKIVGNHTMKFGGELTRLFYLQDCVGCGVPSYNFFNLWDFLNDAPQQESSSFNPTNGQNTTVRQDQRSSIWGFFFQDDFKVRSNLTLNMGLRWSYFSPLRSKENNMFVATPGQGADYLTGLVVHKGESWNAQRDNFSPEVGFAWSPTPFHDRLVIRGGYGLNFNQEEIAISANISSNPGLSVSPTLVMSAPTSPNPGIVYATSTNLHNYNDFPPNPNAITSFGANGLPTGATGINVEVFPNTLPTMRAHHYSLDAQYDLGHKFVASLGYQGSLSRNIFYHANPNAAPAAEGLALNPAIGGGDYWSVLGHANNNSMLAELKHDFSHQFMADAQFTWAKTMDTASSPYSSGLPPYNLPWFPYQPELTYGRSDYNVGKAFKLFGMWQPVFFHGNNRWIEKIAGGWSLSGIWNMHSGFPWTPVASVSSGSLFCNGCGYGSLPAVYLGGGGTSTSNKAFETVANSNFPNGASTYFAAPAYTAYSCSPTCYGNSLPQIGVQRNSFNGPGYRDVDATLAKGFGLPDNRVLGENAKLELRMDVYNVFNNLNLNPTDIVNDIGASNFGTITTSNGSAGLAGRVLTVGARFSF